MRIRNKASFGVTLALLIFMLVFFRLALDYGAKERSIPLGVLIPCIALALLLLLGEMYPALTRKFDIKAGLLAKRDFRKSSPVQTTGPEASTGKIIGVCLWSAAFFGLVFLVGFLIAIPVYLLLFLRLHGQVKWAKVIMLTLITWGAVYVFFEILLGEELFRGILSGAYIPPL